MKPGEAHVRRVRLNEVEFTPMAGRFRLLDSPIARSNIRREHLDSWQEQTTATLAAPLLQERPAEFGSALEAMKPTGAHVRRVRLNDVEFTPPAGRFRQERAGEALLLQERPAEFGAEARLA